MKKEVVLNFIFTLSMGLCLFLQNKYFVKYMGIESYGIMKLFTQLLAYLNIAELGLGNASSFALYKPLAEKNYNQVSIIMSTIESIYNKIAIVLIFLGFFVTPWLPFFMKMKNFTNDIYIYWILYMLSMISTYLYIKYVILFTANKEFIYVRYIQSVSKVFYQFIQILIIIKYSSFIYYILVFFLDNITQYIIFKFHYKKYYSYVKTTVERYGELKKDIKNLFWHKIGGLIVFNTDIILISKLISVEIAGIYGSYQFVLQIILTFTNVFINILRPRVGHYIVLNSKEEVYNLFKKLNIIFLYLSIILSYVNLVLISSFVILWLGKEYVFSTKTVLLLTINLFVQIFRNIEGMFKDATGFFDDIQSPIYESIINLVFSVILGLQYGLNGIIIGTIISNITIILIYKPILVFKNCFAKGTHEYIKVYINYLILIVLVVGVLIFTDRIFIKISIRGWIDFMKAAIYYSIKISIISFIIFLINKEFRNIILENFSKLSMRVIKRNK